MRRRNFYYVDDAAKLAHEIVTRDYIYVSVDVAQEYLLNHFEDHYPHICFASSGVPGVCLAKEYHG